MSSIPIPEEFSLWNVHSWGEIEEELAEVSGTARAQYDAARKNAPFLHQESIAQHIGQKSYQMMVVRPDESPTSWQQEHQQFMSPGFEYFGSAFHCQQAHQSQIPLQPGYYESQPRRDSMYQDLLQQQSPFQQQSPLQEQNPPYMPHPQWGQVDGDQQPAGLYQGQFMSHTSFQQENTPPLVPLNIYSIAIPRGLPNSRQMFILEFLLGDLIDYGNTMLMTVYGDSKLCEAFDEFFKVVGNASTRQWQIPKDYYFMQIFWANGIVNYGMPEYYHGAKATGRMVQDVDWYPRQKITLVGSERAQTFF